MDEKPTTRTNPMHAARGRNPTFWRAKGVKAPELPVVSVFGQRCKAKTKAGKRCRREAAFGLDTCTQHANSEGS